MRVRNRHPCVVATVCRLYALLIWLYPPALRRAFGRELVVTFRSRVEDVLSDGGVREWITFAAHIMWDTIRTSGTSVGRLDVVTGAYTTLWGFGPAGPIVVEPVTRTSDGLIYFTVRRAVSEAIYVLDLANTTPVVGLVPPRLLLLPSAEGGLPSRLVEAADGHLYGVAAHDGGSGEPVHDTIFRIRRGSGGQHAYEPLRQLDRASVGSGFVVELTLARDGFIYGYAVDGGPAGRGSLYRFDPLERGGAADPLQFEVLEGFRSDDRTGNPSAPAAASNGFLYGATTTGGATGRGAVYRLDPASDTVTLLGAMPASPLESSGRRASAGAIRVLKPRRRPGWPAVRNVHSLLFGHHRKSCRARRPDDGHGDRGRRVDRIWRWLAAIRWRPAYTIGRGVRPPLLVGWPRHPPPGAGGGRSDRRPRHPNLSAERTGDRRT